MAGVSRAQPLTERAVAVGRRFSASPDWPLIAAGILGLLAIVEVMGFSGRGAGTEDTPAERALLLAAGTTVPLALARWSVAATAALITAANALTLANGDRPTAAGIVALLIAGYLLGLSVTERIRARMRDRAAARRAVSDVLVEHVARGERARIARELHDVVAHHISMIAVQAETARLTTSGMPDEGARHLTAIAETARSALAEMRRLLGVLREDAGPSPEHRTPQPGLERLIQLIDEARDVSRSSTRLIVDGCVISLDPGVELTAYRIVQEALTNARRHAPGSCVDVELHYADDLLQVRIRDNGPGPKPGSDAGHGLIGMRERAAMVGGEVFAGAGPDGGFVVEAVLPAIRTGS